MYVYSCAYIFLSFIHERKMCMCLFGCHLYSLPLPLKKHGKSRFKDYVAILI